ncbi:MAG: pYEATS domain-containing protein [Bacteroidota bacterium]
MYTKTETQLRLRNSWKYVGEKRWDWSVFLEDDGSGEMDKVVSVRYILHPSFANPRRLKTNKEEKFALKTNGWGVFMIRAFVQTEEGEKIRLEHYLHLSYDPKEGVTD